MLIKSKINLKKYFLLSLLPLALSLFFVTNWRDVLGIGIVYLATVANHLLLIQGVMIYLTPGNTRRLIPLLLFVGKFLVLALGLSLGVLFMGNRVIIPLVNYLVLISILVVSIRK